jgi:hypothetical protein
MPFMPSCAIVSWSKRKTLRELLVLDWSCFLVFANSNGYVMVASTPPATSPANNDNDGDIGDYAEVSVTVGFESTLKTTHLDIFFKMLIT